MVRHAGLDGAGVADWWCHRRSDIEHTAGATESAIHSTMMVESAVPTLLGLFCEIDAGTLAVTYSALALHEASGLWDVAYADGRREVTPFEQYVHGFGSRADDRNVLADRPALGSSASRGAAARLT